MKTILAAIMLFSVPCFAAAEPITLGPPEVLVESLGPPRMLVGGNVVDRAEKIPPAKTPWRRDPLVSAMTLRPTHHDVMDDLGDLFDYVVVEDGVRSQTDVVHLLIPSRGLSPFAAVARESRIGMDDETTSRVGFGAGAMLKLGHGASFGTELILFPPDRTITSESDKVFGDLKLLTRLQISF